MQTNSEHLAIITHVMGGDKLVLDRYSCLRRVLVYLTCHIIMGREIAVVTLLLNQQCSGGTSAEIHVRVLVSITTNHTLSVRIMGKLRRRGQSNGWVAHLSIAFSPRANTTVFVSFH